MTPFEHHEYDSHETVSFHTDDEVGFHAIIALHDLSMGPALGGLRMAHYSSKSEALSDALRLSKGMTYKNALARVPYGGGKAVIALDKSRTYDKNSLLSALARFVHHYNGRYITAEDSGITTDDIFAISKLTPFVRNLPFDEWGDPSQYTAHGVFTAMCAACEKYLDKPLNKAHVALQGLGKVGLYIAAMLKDNVSQLTISDIDDKKAAFAAKKFGALIVPTDQIYSVDADIFAPCAMGAILNEHTIPQLKAKIVVGAANNQLSKETDAVLLQEHGILYAPDFAINAGGILSVPAHGEKFDPAKAVARAKTVATTLIEILEYASKFQCDTHQAAMTIARQRLKEGK